MKKFICSVCGYVYEGEEAPEKCPQCGAPKDKFTVMGEGKKEYADEHVLGVAKGVDERVIEGLRQNFTGECSEVGMYLAMSRVAFREGYPEVGLYYEKAAHEEAEHASKFAEMLGEVLSDSTKKNLEMRAAAEQGACKGKKELATLAKQLGYDAIHDTVHEKTCSSISRNHVFLRLFFNRLNEVVIAFSESVGIWLVPSLASLGVTSILRAINRFDWTISRG